MLHKNSKKKEEQKGDSIFLRCLFTLPSVQRTNEGKINVLALQSPVENRDCREERQAGRRTFSVIGVQDAERTIRGVRVTETGDRGGGMRVFLARSSQGKQKEVQADKRRFIEGTVR